MKTLSQSMSSPVVRILVCSSLFAIGIANEEAKADKEKKIKTVEYDREKVVGEIDAAIAIAADPRLEFALGRMRTCADRNDTKLDLGRLGLRKLPQEIWKLTKLTHLVLIDNRLTSLPPEIGKLTNLTVLSVETNKLAKLPPEIGKLTMLTRLSLLKNQLTTLPVEIGQLTNLGYLVIYENQLKSLPPEIGKLTELRTLLLGGNRLAMLPPEIGNLTKLRYLGLLENPITDTDLQHLRPLIELKDVNLRHTKATREGVSALGEALPKCKIKSSVQAEVAK